MTTPDEAMYEAFHKYHALTRIGKRTLDEHDNLGSSLKHVADEIAALYGVDDSPASPLRFEVRQEIGKEYGVLVDIWGQDAAD